MEPVTLRVSQLLSARSALARLADEAFVNTTRLKLRRIRRFVDAACEDPVQELERIGAVQPNGAIGVRADDPDRDIIVAKLNEILNAEVPLSGIERVRESDLWMRNYTTGERVPLNIAGVVIDALGPLYDDDSDTQPE